MTLKNLMILLTFIGIFSLTYAQAEDASSVISRKWDQSTGISKVYFGYTGATADVGLSHERRLKNIGWDVLALFSADDNDGIEVRDEQYHLSSSLVYHVVDNSAGDVYVGTGLAAVLHNDTGVRNDGTEFALGPTIKLGGDYYFNNNWSLGLEYLSVFNWTNDMLAGNQDYALLNVGYTY